MSRQFSMPTVLRMVPNPLLKAFFEELGHGDFDPNWPELKEREIDPIIDFIGDLPLKWRFPSARPHGETGSAMPARRGPGPCGRGGAGETETLHSARPSSPDPAEPG